MEQQRPQQDTEEAKGIEPTQLEKQNANIPTPLLDDQNVVNELNQMEYQQSQNVPKQVQNQPYERAQAAYPSLTEQPAYMPQEKKQENFGFQKGNISMNAFGLPTIRSSKNQKQDNQYSMNQVEQPQVNSSQPYDYHTVIKDDERAQELENLALKHQKIKDQLNAIKAANQPAATQIPLFEPSGITVTTDGEMEFREIEEQDMASENKVKRLYYVHQVQPMNDSLNIICMHFKVNKTLVQKVNKIRGEDIFYLKELLIPCQTKDQIINIGALRIQKTQNQINHDNSIMQKQLLEQMSETIKILETKQNKELKKLGVKVAKEKAARHYENDAKYYLENNSYDYRKALEEYKSDCSNEMESYKINYKKNKTSKVSYDQNGNVIENKQNDKCQIF